MSASPSPRDMALACALLAGWSLVVIWLRWGLWAPDLSALLIAAWLWGHGLPDLIYAAPPGFFGGAAAEWSEPMARMGIAGQQTYPYLYPPLWAALLAPLTQGVPVPALMNAALVIQIPLLAASVLLAGRLAKPAAMAWSVWALWGLAVLSLSAPAILTVMHLQPTIVTGFVILLAFERLASGRPGLFGALIALAAAIKLGPAFLILAVLMIPSLHALIGFALTGTALALLSVGLAGWDAHQAMLDSVGTVSAQSLMIALNLSLQSVLTQLALGPDTLPAAIEAPLVPVLIGRAAAVLAFGLLVWRARGWVAADRPVGVLLGLSLLLWLFGPLGWLHYFVVPLLMLPALGRLADRRAAWVSGAAATAMLSMPVYLGIAALPGFHALYPALAGGCLLLVLAALIAAPPRKTAGRARDAS